MCHSLALHLLMTHSNTGTWSHHVVGQQAPVKGIDALRKIPHPNKYVNMIPKQ